MKFILNVLWILFGGWFTALLWCIGGLLCCITVVGIPLGVQCFKCAKLSFAPFGKKVDLNYGEHPIANTIWLIFVGWEFFLGYLFIGIVYCVTIIGIPLGIQTFKFSKLSLAPFGAKVGKNKK